MQVMIAVYLIYILIMGKYHLIFQTCFALILSLYSYVLEKFFKIKIPPVIQIMLNTLIFIAQFLGEVIGLYYALPWWDNLIHTLMGGIDFLIGFHVLEPITKEKKHRLLIAFMFSVTIAVFWEFVEFGLDRIFGTNMQTFRLEGEDGLKDTMFDLLEGVLGALIVIVFYIKKKVIKIR